MPPCPYLLFFPWWKKRRQKKIKASTEAGEVYRVHDWSWKWITFWGHNDLIIWKRVTFLGYSFHRWNVCGAYAIRPYRVTGKRVDFLGFHVGAYCIRPTGRHPKNSEYTKRITFSGYKDLIIWKRITFSGYLFHRWNVCGAYAIRPYRVTGKRIAFLRYNDLIIRKRTTFLGYLFHRWNVCGAYAIRPYRVTGKRITFLRYNDLIIRKRITFWIFIFDEWWKRDSFFGYNDLIIRKRITFSGYIDLGIWKSGALPPFPYLLFLSWYKKRRQKKIKASAEAEEVDRVHDWSWKCTRKKLPCPGRGLSLMKEKKAKENQGLCRGRGSWPGTWLILKTHHVLGT